MEDMMRIIDKKAMVDLITTLWNCWNSRNKFIFKGQVDNAQSKWEKASNLINEFRILQPSESSHISLDWGCKEMGETVERHYQD
ncbi:hypothetical protein Goari_018523 [Gossypium aridum]|uniref:Uncharacterized protein n=1 Tax=Gossypium aridum TaxID=34290 RepID=A0A7J8WPV4_GOSAI|nr:hypothetical protein [Gossypium aridum]